MSFHHPALAQTGELEIAQRQALHMAEKAALNHWAGPLSSQVRASVEAYLKSMASYVPGPIVIGEGDHIEVQVGEGGGLVKVGVENGYLSLDDGDEIHYPTRSAT